MSWWYHDVENICMSWRLYDNTWWRHQMEIPAQRPVTRSFDVFFDLRLNNRLSKQSWGWWSETLPCPFWRHCNEITHDISTVTIFVQIYSRQAHWIINVPCRTQTWVLIPLLPFSWAKWNCDHILESWIQGIYLAKFDVKFDTLHCTNCIRNGTNVCSQSLINVKSNWVNYVIMQISI